MGREGGKDNGVEEMANMIMKDNLMRNGNCDFQWKPKRKHKNKHGDIISHQVYS